MWPGYRLLSGAGLQNDKELEIKMVFSGMLFIHLMLFVYWLGGDLGTFYASFHATRSNVPLAGRATAFRIMMGLDLVPRICMPLMFPVGLSLAAGEGWLTVSGESAVAVWLLGLAWMGVAVGAHLVHQGGWARLVRRIDFWLRVGFMVTAAISGIAVVLMESGLTWLGCKMMIFASTVFCGLMVRRSMTPVLAAIQRTMGGTAETADVVAIAAAMKICRHWVLIIWALLLLAAAFGLHLLG